MTTTKPSCETTKRATLDELLDIFEKMPSEERRRDIEQANAFLRGNGIDSLAKLDEWARK